MVTTVTTGLARPTVRSQEWRQWLMLGGWFSALFAISALLALFIFRRGPSPALIAWIVYLALSAAIVCRPRYGVYLLVGLALAGDGLLTPWYPFTKNLSSGESIFYISNAVIFAPVELTLALTLAAWLVPELAQRKLRIYRGETFWPLLAFTFFITTGLVYGIVQGGDLVIALWAVRGIYLLPAIAILASNLLNTRSQVNYLIWWAVAGIFADSISGVLYVANVLHWDSSTVPAIAEHSYSIHINFVIVLAIAAWFYRGSTAKRIILPLMMPVMLISYFANQRRAGFVAIAAAMILFAVALYWRNRKLFWRTIPIAAILTAVYLAVFWNGGGGAIGAPAWKLRMAIAPIPGSEEESSNIYRMLENVNTMFTIKSSPLFGVGFGNKFYSVVALPDISFFIWYEYFTHNSILWMWMQAGVGGFISMIYLFGISLFAGARTLLRLPSDDMSAVAFSAICLILMHCLFAYVDMSWETQNMVLLGALIGVLDRLEYIAGQPEAPQPLRWPWQQPRPSAPGLLPL